MARLLHYNWNLLTWLLGAIDTATCVEYFYRDQDIKVFDDLVANPDHSGGRCDATARPLGPRRRA